MMEQSFEKNINEKIFLDFYRETIKSLEDDYGIKPDMEVAGGLRKIIKEFIKDRKNEGYNTDKNLKGILNPNSMGIIIGKFLEEFYDIYSNDLKVLFGSDSDEDIKKAKEYLRRKQEQKRLI